MEFGDKFYNEDRKKSFIDEYSKHGRTENSKGTRIKDCNTVFNNTAIIEKRYDKDFSDFLNGSTEIDDLYLIWLNNITAGRVKIYAAILNAYLRWCYENNYITAKGYTSHAFYAIYNEPKENKQHLESHLTLKRMEVAKSAKDNAFSKDFIFKDQNSFIKYISVLFSGDRFVMPAAMAVLLYYQFGFETVRNILKSDVDVVNHTVSGIDIDNPCAFKMILNAMNATEYISIVESKNNVAFERITEYVNSPYLLRPISRGPKYSNGQVSVNYPYKMNSFEDEAMKVLDPNSPYHGITIRAVTILRLKEFHTMKKDEEQYGYMYVKKKIDSNEYNSTLTYHDYCVLSSKARSIG